MLTKMSLKELSRTSYNAHFRYDQYYEGRMEGGNGQQQQQPQQQPVYSCYGEGHIRSRLPEGYSLPEHVVPNNRTDYRASAVVMTGPMSSGKSLDNLTKETWIRNHGLSLVKRVLLMWINKVFSLKRYSFRCKIKMNKFYFMDD